MTLVITVSQLTAQIRTLLEADERLRDVWLEGEVSNFRQAPSGHCYFTLKDAASALPCVMWRSQAQWLSRLPADGEQLVAHGYVSIYEVQGKIQFYVDHIDLAGLGHLYQEFETLKARLAAEGLFDEARKRPLPAWPRRVGVVTSAGAAALRDILRTAAARYPLAEILLAPAQVQGAEASGQMVAALELLDAWSLGVEQVDVIILARGGGSIEELWAFNDERLARAVATSRLPIVSGVGHETDFTLVDFVADVRAPTPTGAAMQALPDRLELLSQLQRLRNRLLLVARGRLVAERRQLAQANHRLRRVSPQAQVVKRRQQIDDLSQRAWRLMRHRVDLRRTQLAGLEARLHSLDPQAVLARGYAVVRRGADQAVVTSVRQVQSGDRFTVLVRDGQFEGLATEVPRSDDMEVLDGRTDL